MGIYESVQRSQGHIDSLAGRVQGYFAKKREEENRKRLRGLLSERVSQLTPETESAVESTQAMARRSIPVESPATRNVASPLEKGTLPSRMVGPQVETVDRLKELGDLGMDEILELGGMLRESPGLRGDVNLMQGVAAANRPKREVKEVEGELWETVMDRLRGTSARKIGGPGKYRAPDYAGPTLQEQIRRNKELEAQGRDRNSIARIAATAGGKEKKQWLLREGKVVHSYAREGDLPYDEKSVSGRETKLWESSKKLSLDADMIEQGLFNDTMGNPVDPQSKTAKVIIANLRAQINQNTEAMNRLRENSQSGGGDSKSTTLKAARESYGEEAAGWNDADLTKFLEENGYVVRNQ